MSGMFCGLDEYGRMYEDVWMRMYGCMDGCMDVCVYV